MVPDEAAGDAQRTITAHSSAASAVATHRRRSPKASGT